MTSDASSRSLAEEGVPPPKIKIMHYTLGGIKPWHWVPAIFLPYTGLWVQVRTKMAYYHHYYPIMFGLTPTLISCVFLQVNMLLKETGKELKRKAKAAAAPASSIRRMATAFLILGLTLGITGFLLFMRACIQRNRVPADERTPVSPATWTKALNNFLQSRGRADSSASNSGAPSGIQMQLLASLFSGAGTTTGSRPPSLSRETSGLARGFANQVPLRWPTASALLFVLFGYTSVCIALLSGLTLVSSLQLSTPQLGWTAFLSCTLLTFVLLEALFLAILVRTTGQSTIPPQPVTSLPFTQGTQTGCRPASGTTPSTSRDLPPILCEVAAYALLLAQGAGLAVMGSPLLSTHTSTLRTIMYYSYVILALLALFTLALLRLPASWQARDLRAPGSQQPQAQGLLPP